MNHETYHSHEPTAERSRWKKRIAGALGATAAAAAGLLAWRSGFNPADYVSAEEGKLVLQPEVVPSGINALIAANDAARNYAPYVAGAGLAGLATVYGLSKTNERVGATYRMSNIDYDGAQNRGESSGTRKDRLGTRIKNGVGRTLAAGGIVGIATAGMAAGASGLQEDIAEGGNRPVEALFDNFAEFADASGFENTYTQQNILLQEGGSHFMNDSAVERQQLDELSVVAAERGIAIIPFNKLLPNINDGNTDRAAIVTSIPDAWFEEATGRSIDTSCDTVPVILGEATGKKAGEAVTINGIGAQVAAVVGGNIEQMNRDVGVVSDTDMRECLLLGHNEAAFGAVVLGGKVEEVQQLLEERGMGNLAEVISKEEFMQNNREFWDKNGTPLLLQMILEIGALGGAAMAALRSGQIQAGTRKMGALNALGVDQATFSRIELLRAGREAAWATAYGTPVALGLTAVSNALVTGLNAGVGPKEIAVGGALMLTAKGIGSARAVSKFGDQELELVLR